MTTRTRSRSTRAFTTKPLAAALAAAFAASASHATSAQSHAHTIAARPLAARNATPAGPGGGNVVPVTDCTESALRTAIDSADDGDTIDLSALTCSTITLRGAQLLPKFVNLTLHGPTDHALTLDGHARYGRIIQAFGAALTIDHLTLANGSAGPADQRRDGGCVYAGGNLTLSYSAVHGCVGESGGGISSQNGDVFVTHSTISGNTAEANGGGIVAEHGDIHVSDSTISGNTAQQDGGGLSIRMPEANAVVENSTISGNTATTWGGGIAVFPHGHLTVHNSTITLNAGGLGGGIALQNYSATIEMESSIAFGNSSTASSGRDIMGDSGDGGTVIHGSHNIIGDTPLDKPGDTLTGDPGLGPLADNGGPTWTHALPANSIALDVGSNPDGQTHDQRGYARTAGANTDIGAYELGGGVPLCSDATLRNAVAAAGDGDVVDLSMLANCTITLIGGELPVNVNNLSLHGPADGSLTIDGKYLTRVFDHTGTGTLAFDHMTLAHGYAVGSGGCVYTPGSIVLNEVTVTGCTATGSGGGVFANQVITADASTISNNTSQTWAGGAGTLYGNIDVTRCTFSGNHAEAVGGGLYSFFGIHTSISDSTISGNSSATRTGGGVAAFYGLTVHNSTIAFNSAPQGGGIHIANAPIEITSSIVSNNDGLVDISSDSGGIVIDGSHNLIASSIPTVPADTLVADPGLAPLADNGGPTRTHAIDLDSPAFNAGSNPDMLGSDQRGDGFVRAFGGAPDIGAFELQTPPTAMDDAYATAAGVALTTAAPGVLANDSDAFGHPLSAVLAVPPGHGTLVLNPDGSFTYAPDSGYIGLDSFAYRADDGMAASAPATVTITISIDDTIFADGFDAP